MVFSTTDPKSAAYRTPQYGGGNLFMNRYGKLTGFGKGVSVALPAITRVAGTVASAVMGIPGLGDAGAALGQAVVGQQARLNAPSEAYRDSYDNAQESIAQSAGLGTVGDAAGSLIGGLAGSFATGMKSAAPAVTTPAEDFTVNPDPLANPLTPALTTGTQPLVTGDTPLYSDNAAMDSLFGGKRPKNVRVFAFGGFAAPTTTPWIMPPNGLASPYQLQSPVLPDAPNLGFFARLFDRSKRTAYRQIQDTKAQDLVAQYKLSNGLVGTFGTGRQAYVGQSPQISTGGFSFATGGMTQAPGTRELTAAERARYGLPPLGRPIARNPAPRPATSTPVIKKNDPPISTGLSANDIVAAQGVDFAKNWLTERVKSGDLGLQPTDAAINSELAKPVVLSKSGLYDAYKKTGDTQVTDNLGGFYDAGTNRSVLSDAFGRDFLRSSATHEATHNIQSLLGKKVSDDSDDIYNKAYASYKNERDSAWGKTKTFFLNPPTSPSRSDYNRRNPIRESYDNINTEVTRSGKPYDIYFSSPNEIHARIMELRQHMGAKPNVPVTMPELLKFRERNGNNREYGELYKVLDHEGILNSLNKTVLNKSVINSDTFRAASGGAPIRRTSYAYGGLSGSFAHPSDYKLYSSSDKKSEDLVMTDKKTGEKFGEMRYGEYILPQDKSLAAHDIMSQDASDRKKRYALGSMLMGQLASKPVFAKTSFATGGPVKPKPKSAPATMLPVATVRAKRTPVSVKPLIFPKATPIDLTSRVQPLPASFFAGLNQAQPAVVADNLPATTDPVEAVVVPDAANRAKLVSGLTNGLTDLGRLAAGVNLASRKVDTPTIPERWLNYVSEVEQRKNQGLTPEEMALNRNQIASNYAQGFNALTMQTGGGANPGTVLSGLANLGVQRGNATQSLLAQDAVRRQQNFGQYGLTTGQTANMETGLQNQRIAGQLQSRAIGQNLVASTLKNRENRDIFQRQQPAYDALIASETAAYNESAETQKALRASIAKRLASLDK